MKKQMPKEGTRIVELSMIALASLVLLSGTVVHGADAEWTPTDTTSIDVDGDGSKEDVYLWNTSSNWRDKDTGEESGTPTNRAIIGNGATDSNRVVINGNADGFGHDLHLGLDAWYRSGYAGDATIDILSGARLYSSRIAYIGRDGYTGTINLRGGTHDQGPWGTDMRLGHTGGHGKYNVYDGLLNVDSALHLGTSDNGSGEINFYGGELDSDNNIEVASDEYSATNTSGVFNVAGSGATNISIGGNWIQSAGGTGTLQIGVDDGGVTPIDITGDVTFDTDSFLDVGFLDGHEEYGSWTVMTWTGSETGLDNLALDSTVGDNWVLHKNTTNSGNLTVEYVPEPSSLLLLGIAGLLLMKRRRM